MKSSSASIRWYHFWKGREFRELVLDLGPDAFRKESNYVAHDSPLENIMEAVQALPDAQHKKQLLLESIEILWRVEVAAQEPRV
jgi:hypothetical protein